MNPHTLCVQHDEFDLRGSVPTSAPIVQTATFAQSSATAFDEFDYSRSGNPTRSALERRLAQLERARHAFAFSSGVAASHSVTQLLRPGDEVLLGDDIYGGTHRLLDSLRSSQGISVTSVDTTDLRGVERAMTQRTRLVLIESPSNPLQKISDIEALAACAQRFGALLAVDNTFLSPYLQNPLELGAHLVIHSATKHLCGHSDLTAGCVVTSDDSIAERVSFVQNAAGSALAPFEAWLLLRGLKTLAVRLDRQQQSAERMAAWLSGQSWVRAIHFAGLDDHPGSSVQRRQARGAGCVISIETGDFELSKRIVEGTRLFSIAVSFGGVASTISLPCFMSHASVPAAQQQRKPLPRDLVRLSIGLEDADELIADIERVAPSHTTKSIRRRVPAPA